MCLVNKCVHATITTSLSLAVANSLATVDEASPKCQRLFWSMRRTSAHKCVYPKREMEWRKISEREGGKNSMQANKSGAQKLPRLARNGEMATRQMAMTMAMAMAMAKAP